MPRPHDRRSVGLLAVSRSLLLVPVLSLTACIGDATPPCSVSAISVGVPGTTVAVGQTIQATASFTAQNCSPAPTVTWSSENNAIATVNATGQISGVSAGAVSIRATVNNNVGSRAITVVAGP